MHRRLRLIRPLCVKWVKVTRFKIQKFCPQIRKQEFIFFPDQDKPESQMPKYGTRHVLVLMGEYSLIFVYIYSGATPMIWLYTVHIWYKRYQCAQWIIFFTLLFEGTEFFFTNSNFLIPISLQPLQWCKLCYLNLDYLI